MGSIQGRVTDADEQPMEDVTVMIVTGPTHQDIAALTGSDGMFSFSSLKPGNYVLRAQSDSASIDSIDVRVRARRVAFVEITLDPGDVVDEI